LGNNAIGTRGALHLAETLGLCGRGMRFLELGANGICRRGVQALLAATCATTDAGIDLVELGLARNSGFDSDMQERLDEQLAVAAHNRRQRALPLQLPCWPAVLQLRPSGPTLLPPLAVDNMKQAYADFNRLFVDSRQLKVAPPSNSMSRGSYILS
jgi:hypothetical protein